jgi:XTP/dITP diphosphohydrolase
VIRAQLASTNPGKARELEALLSGWQIESLGARDYPPEDGDTYLDNARIKARFGREVGDPEAWIIGEDSGIEVAGLDWGPGVQTARFGGDEQVVRLLAALEGIEGEGRKARYVCELVVLDPDGREHRGTGTLEGRIGHEPLGNEGFGYDPIFIPDGEQQTAAQLGDAWKQLHSHRAKAAQALLRELVPSG